MTQPTNEAINQTLAEFMGFKAIQYDSGMTYIHIKDPVVHIRVFNYTSSLDACIPVVEKLLLNDIAELSLFWNRNGSWAETYHMKDQKHISIGMFAPSLALSTALYHVIKELK